MNPTPTTPTIRSGRPARTSIGLALLTALGAASLCGCAGDSASKPSESAAAPTGPAFASPEASVPIISTLIRQSQWSVLAGYYDLSITPHVRKEDMLSGRFFVDAGASATSGPTAVSRYRQPFPPGSKFVSAKPEGDAQTLPCVWTMTTMLEIDQGGGMMQRVLTECRLIQRSDGYRLLAPARVQ